MSPFISFDLIAFESSSSTAFLRLLPISVEEEDNSEAEELRVKVEQLEKENKTLKIQKAKNKQKKAEPKAKSEKTESLTRDEAILFARGLSEEEVEKAKSIAKIEEQSVIEAVDSDFFTIWKDKNDKAKETQETQLGASKGSARALRRKTFSDSDLTAEEHKELFNKKMGR